MIRFTRSLTALPKFRREKNSRMLNFPNYKDKEILIHKNNCGFCKNETGNTTNGFWAGPFTKIEDAEINLIKLNKKI